MTAQIKVIRSDADDHYPRCVADGGYCWIAGAVELPYPATIAQAADCGRRHLLTEHGIETRTYHRQATDEDRRDFWENSEDCTPGRPVKPSEATRATGATTEMSEPVSGPHTPEWATSYHQGARA